MSSCDHLYSQGTSNSLTLQGKLSAGLSSVGLLLGNTLGDASGTLLVGTAVGELVAAAVVGEDDVGPAVVGDTLSSAIVGDTLSDTVLGLTMT